MSTVPEPERRHELVGLALLTLTFLAVNLLTAARYPMPWVDEIQFADAAINLYLGQGFTSSVWIAQPADAFWAGNTPLYTGLLYLWLKLFGLSIEVVRSLNFVLISIVVWLVRGFVSARGLVANPRCRLLLALLLFTGHALMFSFRMGRYDVLGMLLFAAAALAWAGPPTRSRLAAVGLAAMLAPVTGLQLLPASVLYCGLLLIFQGRAAIPRIAAVGLGLAIGAALLYGFYASHGVWDAFRASTSAVGVIGQGLAFKILSLPKVYTADKSSLALVCAALLLAVARPRRNWRFGPLEFSLAATAVIPTCLQLMAKFPIYYAWMIYGPLAIGVASALSSPQTPVRPAVRGLSHLLILAACLIGLPMRLLGVALLWDTRDPDALARYAAAQIVPSDRVLTDFKAYYAVKTHAAALYAPTAIGVMRSEEKQSVTALLIQPKDFARLTAALGGTWHESGPPLTAGFVEPGIVHRLMREFGEENYPLQFYRRDSSAP